MYGPPSGYAPPPGPPPPGPPSPGRQRSSGRQSAWWLVSAAVAVIAAVVIITLVLTGGGGAPLAGGTTPPSPTRNVSAPTVGASTSLSEVPNGAPTTDALPSNAGSGSCSQDVQPGLVAVSVATVLGLSTKGAKPNSYVADVLRDCTSASVRSRIELLVGIQFGTDYSGDLSGGNDSGPTAVYRVSNAAGTGTLELTLTRQQDKHYEVTGFSYSG